MEGPQMGQEMPVPPGTVLRNNATVILSHPRQSGLGAHPSAIVLCRDPGGKEWVSWELVMPKGMGNLDESYCVTGQYRHGFTPALLDFYERSDCLAEMSRTMDAKLMGRTGIVDAGGTA